MKLDDFLNIKILAKGSSIMLYKGITKENKTVMIKALRNDKLYLNEAEIINHEYVLSKKMYSERMIKKEELTGCKNKMCVVTEYFEGTTLRQIMNTEKLYPKNFFEISIALITEIEKLHKKRIIYEDLRPENILISYDLKEIKIWNFESSDLENETIFNKYNNIPEVALAYMSPEQTGIINRNIDMFTDFYSYGVILYEIITGNLPFENKNITELVYCHIVKRPTEPRVINRNISKNSSDIIMKLLSKNPEDRYKSCNEIRDELKKSRDEKKNEDVKINYNKCIMNLYRMKEETFKLKNIYKRVMQNNTEIAFVLGKRGTGKTIIVNEFLNSMEEQHPVFICNCDKNKEDIPFYCFIDGVKKYVNDIRNNKYSVNSKLAYCFKKHAQLLYKIIPELNIYLDRRNNTNDLNIKSIKIDLVLQSLVKKFCEIESSFIVFIDNFQCIDEATFKLVNNLISILSKNNVFFIICDHETDKETYKTEFIKQNAERSGVYVSNIEVQKLNIDEIEQLITQNCGKSNFTKQITNIISEKTKGNVSAINQMFDIMWKQKMIHFDYTNNVWNYNIQDIKTISNFENMDIVIKNKYDHLSNECRNMINNAACIGQKFNIEDLELFTDKKEDEMFSVLEEAMTYGIIAPCTNKGTYRFIENRIHSIIYASINNNEKEYIHYLIAQKMLKKNKKDNSIFTIINHYNIGKSYIKESREKIKLAILNYNAGNLAENYGAFETAEVFYENGIEIIPKDLYNKFSNIMFFINEKYVRTKITNKRYEEAYNLTSILSRKACTVYKKYYINRIYILYYLELKNYNKVIEIGIKALEDLGINNNFKENIEDKQETFIICNKILEGQFENIENNHFIKSKKKECALNLLYLMMYDLEMYKFKFFENMVINVLKYCLQNSESEFLPYIYIKFSLILLTKHEDYKNAYAIGRKGYYLINKSKNEYMKSNALFLYGTYISNIGDHISSSCRYLQDSIEKKSYGFENRHKYSLMNTMVLLMILEGRNIDYINAEIKKYINQFVENIDYSYMHTILCLKRFIECLKKPDGKMDSVKCQKNKPMCIDNEFNDIIIKLCLNFTYYFDDQHDDVINKYTLSRKQLNLIKGTIFDFTYVFAKSISMVSLYDRSSEKIKKSYIASLRYNLKRLKNYSKINPANFECRYLLLLGEYYRIIKNKNKAIDYYDKAIKSAKDNKFINIKALANEIAARFYMNNNYESSARIYLLEAIHCYKVWGAYGSAKRLENKHSDILRFNSYGEEDVENPKKYNYSKAELDNIDLKSTMKSLFAISSEIEKERLIEKLLENVMLNAGAEKAYLIRTNNNQLTIEAEGIIDKNFINVFRRFPNNRKNMIPKSIIYYTIRTMEDVVFNNGHDSVRFAQDPYIIKYKPKSILCVPIILNGNLDTILYLENNITTHAFTKIKLEVLKLICTQAAISIKNAEMFSEIKNLNVKLEEKVKERTYELEKTVEKLKKEVRERKSIQSELIKSERRYRKVVQACPDTIMVDDGNKIVLINEAGARLYGFDKPSEVIGKSVFELIPKDIVFKLRNNCLEHKNNEEVHFFEYEVTKKTGEIIYAETTIAPFEKDSDYKILTITRDITSRKNENVLKGKVEEKSRELDAAKEYDKLRTEFFANVSHELRTPLNVILGAQTVLSMIIDKSVMQNPSNPKINSYMSIIKQNCYRLVRLINNLIDITKMDAGYFQVIFSNNDIISVVENITLSVAEYAKSKGIELYFDTDTEEKVMAFDPDKIERIILNLLSNAIKFTEPYGKIMVKVNDEGDNVRIVVEDTGIGIPEEKQKPIFERFVQVDKSLSRNHEGSGIGLSLVKSLVEMHNGTIRLESKIGCGSKFIIELPSDNVVSDKEYLNKNFTDSNVERINIEFSDIYS